jgi:glycosyltransferase involved in cell wall biosynthesis
MAAEVEQAAARCDRIAWYPNRSDEEVLRRLGEASVFVLPSTNYEGFPKTIVEAYAKGTPVIASRLGAMAELVREGISGACFTAGDAADLAAEVRRTTADAAKLARVRQSTRRIFETEYSANASYPRLLEIYETALRLRHGAAYRPAPDMSPAAMDGETKAYGLESTVVEAQQQEKVEDIEVCA